MRTILFLLVIASLAACSPGGSAGSALPNSPPTTPRPALPAILPGPGSPGEFQPARCPFVLPEEVVEGQDVECGYLTVVEQRAENPATPGRLVQLAVAVFHPPGGAQHPNPVIYLSGGPGGSALELIRFQFELLSAPVFAAGRDLVVFDQRGVGLSRPALDCPEFEQLVQDLLDRQVDARQINEPEIIELFLDRLSACRNNLGKLADLTAYNSATSAADVDDLRSALGYTQVNLWGGSYGTRLALEVMRRYPQGLHSVVLDAVYPPDVDLYVEGPGNFSRALEQLFAACAGNPVCNRAYPELREVFYETVDTLNATPVQSEIENPFTGEKYTNWMNGNTILALTFQLLYDSTIRYLIPKYIYAAHQGDYTAFERARGNLIALQSISSRGMMFSVQCHEEIPFSSAKEFQAEMERFPDLGGMYENGLLGGLSYRICEEWGAGRAEDNADHPVFSDLPTLLMSGEFDPITPPEWGRHAAETLANGYHYEFPGVGHGASVMAGCPSEMFTAFLQNPGATPDDSCIQGMSE